MIKLIVKDGYSFNYTDNYSTGSISNINHNKEFVIDVDKIGSKYHCSFKLDGMYIQIWCSDYKINKIIY